MFKNAIILSGGEGVRMRPLTKYIPKALVEFNGVPLIKNILNLLNTNGVKDIYVTYNYLSEILFNNLKNEVKGFINTTDKDNSYFLFNSFVKHNMMQYQNVVFYYFYNVNDNQLYQHLIYYQHIFLP